MLIRLLIAITLFAAGCVSSGVVPTDGDAYMLTKKSPGCGFSSAEGVKADIYAEANDFCTGKGRRVRTVDVIARDGVPFVRCASAELHFRCID